MPRVAWRHGGRLSSTSKRRCTCAAAAWGALPAAQRRQRLRMRAAWDWPRRARRRALGARRTHAVQTEGARERQRREGTRQGAGRCASQPTAISAASRLSEALGPVALTFSSRKLTMRTRWPGKSLSCSRTWSSAEPRCSRSSCRTYLRRRGAEHRGSKASSKASSNALTHSSCGREKRHWDCA